MPHRLAAAYSVLAAALTSAVPQGSAPVLPARVIKGDTVILQHRADAFARAPKWSLDPTPVMIAGGQAAPDHDLTKARDVELLTDGRLVALAEVGNHLFVFGPNGRPEKSLGRQGNGPGELMAPSGMTRIPGDTLIIPDRANNRINWIVATKGFVASRPFPRGADGAFLHPLGMLRGGQLVLSTAGRIQHGVPGALTRPPASIVLLSPRAESAKAIAAIPDLELVRIATRYRGRAGSQTRPIRFGRTALAAAWDTVIATGSGDGYRIDLRNLRGEVRGSIRVPARRQPVTPAMRTAAVAAALRFYGEPRSEGMVDPAESRRIEQVTPSADSLPPYGQWHVSPNKTLWVVDPLLPDARRGAATAFRQDGAILGRLSWTTDGVPMAFGDDRMVLRTTDEDGVVSLRVFRIRR